jgi:hypothetical protein
VLQVETTTGAPMAEDNVEVLQIGVGVAATCIGVMCSLYHCCCHVWRRLKGHTPVVAAGAAAAAGVIAAGQLATGAAASLSTSPSPVTSSTPCRPQASCGDEETCRINVV